MSNKLYEIHDPVHRTITFSEREKKIIDHPFVQRMRFIRQLGLKSLVYPGATHDRFQHMLGAMHLAGRVFGSLEESEIFASLKRSTKKYLYEIFRFAALLHDVGHGPFSHASESLMPKLKSLKIPRDWFFTFDEKFDATHEDYSVLLIYTLSSPKEMVFGPREAQDVSSLLHHGIKPSVEWVKRFENEKQANGFHEFLQSLISGEIDVDRMDYLLRDAYFAGVPYGNYDLDWLLRRFGAILRDNRPVLVVKGSSLRAFEDFLLARYYMFLQVYFHHTTAAFEYYVERAMKDGEIPLCIPADPYEYADLRDGSVIEAMYDAAKNSKNMWSGLLTRREAAKIIYSFERSRIGSKSRYQEIVKILRAAGLSYFERVARRALSGYFYNKKDGNLILVADRFLGITEYTPIEKVSPLLRKFNEQIDRKYIYVLRKDYGRAVKVLNKKFQIHTVIASEAKQSKGFVF